MFFDKLSWGELIFLWLVGMGVTGGLWLVLAALGAKGQEIKVGDLAVGKVGDEALGGGLFIMALLWPMGLPMGLVVMLFVFCVRMICPEREARPGEKSAEIDEEEDPEPDEPDERLGCSCGIQKIPRA